MNSQRKVLMRLVELEVEAIDNRRVTPADIVDALEGVVEQGKADAKVIVITEDADGNLLTLMTDMTNTEYIGTLYIAMQNYLHGFQHS
jgi:hypothetical protein